MGYWPDFNLESVFIFKNIFNMKNVTDFRKTVETGVDPHLNKQAQAKTTVGSLSNDDGDVNENGEFCPPFFKKYSSTRSVFESFSLVHAKTLNNVKTIAAVTEHA